MVDTGGPGPSRLDFLGRSQFPLNRHANQTRDQRVKSRPGIRYRQARLEPEAEASSCPAASTIPPPWGQSGLDQPPPGHPIRVQYVQGLMRNLCGARGLNFERLTRDVPPDLLGDLYATFCMDHGVSPDPTVVPSEWAAPDPLASPYRRA